MYVSDTSYALQMEPPLGHPVHHRLSFFDGWTEVNIL